MAFIAGQPAVPPFSFIREALKGVLGELEEWLYSEEADDADLAALKAKRHQARFLLKHLRNRESI